MFFGNSRTRFFYIRCLDCEQYGNNQYWKNEKCEDNFHTYYLNVTDILIILMIFIFLSCCEKVHDKKEFSRENSKPC